MKALPLTSESNQRSRVIVRRAPRYDEDLLYELLPSPLFEEVRPGGTIVLKPNWVMESHGRRKDDWEYVITHPALITAVMRKVLGRLCGCGKIIIMDGPQTDASFRSILAKCPVERWRKMAEASGVSFDIIDLRDHEWITRNGIVVERIPLAGDPLGKTLVNLKGEWSEFHGHTKSQRGYYGADYDRAETNRAHNGHDNFYSVSATALAADVFINLAKLKTHRKAGITACLKNLVGVNTYKNYLPHHSEGPPSEGGDQFPDDRRLHRAEGAFVGFLKEKVFSSPFLARIVSPLNGFGQMIFGRSSQVIRSGNWYGNDTIWRTILDLNKVVFYCGPDGALRPGEMARAKKHIGIVDAVLAGEGNGPLAPEPVSMGYVFCGTNPVAIDAACAALMGFDPEKIPVIARAFHIKNFPLCDFSLGDVRVDISGLELDLDSLPPSTIVPFAPHFGWKGRIERTNRI